MYVYLAHDVGEEKKEWQKNTSRKSLNTFECSDLHV
jgi:hypothetical protein